MFPERRRALERKAAFLCLRRGVSRAPTRLRAQSGFSLPTQRCFCSIFFSAVFELLFSAYAEVFLASPPQPPCFPFLCLRRGVSPQSCERQGSASFSLPTQRCFHSSSHAPLKRLLFSAYAEVFLVPSRLRWIRFTFLCLRRGVSNQYRSPGRIASLFSAYAEVFLVRPSVHDHRLAFLCLRRGVSAPFLSFVSSKNFSLPTQRCFLLHQV